MRKDIAKVEEFHRVFKCFIQESPNANLPSDKELELKSVRIALIQEELNELKAAMDNNDIVEIADGISDLLYVVWGTAITYGLQDKIPEIFSHVHDSNMSKLDENGQPIFREDGKVLKGPNYWRPNIAKFLN